MLKLALRMRATSGPIRSIEALAMRLVRDIWIDFHRRRNRQPVSRVTEHAALAQSGRRCAFHDADALLMCVEQVTHLPDNVRMFARLWLRRTATIEGCAEQLGISSRSAYVLRKKLEKALQTRDAETD